MSEARTGWSFGRRHAGLALTRIAASCAICLCFAVCAAACDPSGSAAGGADDGEPGTGGNEGSSGVGGDAGQSGSSPPRLMPLGPNRYAVPFVANSGSGGSTGDVASADGDSDSGVPISACIPNGPTGTPPAVAICGDGFRSGTEQCDDGNTNDGDACSSTCQVTPQLVAPRSPSSSALPLPGRQFGNSPHPLASGCNTVGLAFVDQGTDAPTLTLATFSNVGVPLAVLPFGQANVDQPAPAVAALSDDTFAVVWTDFGGDGDELGIRLQKLDPHAASLPEPLFANANSEFSQHASDIVFDGNELIVAWMDDSDAATAPDLRYRLFRPDFTPLSGDLTLSATSAVEGNVSLAAVNGAWAAAWRSGSAGSETIEVQSGGSHWSVGPFVAGPAGESPALAFFDATHLAVAFTEGADAATGAGTSRLHAAILDPAFPGTTPAFEIAPTFEPYASASSQSQPALAVFSDRLLVSWRSSGVPGVGDELWTRDLKWSLANSQLIIDVSSTESPLVGAAFRPGDQSAPALLSSPNWPEHRLFSAWQDWGRAFGSASGSPDVALQIAQARTGPVLSWLSPSVSKLNRSNDLDQVALGWQGVLSIQTDLAGTGATVQFSANPGNLGDAVAVGPTGIATSPVVTIPDQASVTLTATTSEVADRGTGTISLTATVDTLLPAGIVDLAASVPPALRRDTTFHLAWTAPDDHGRPVATYDVRVSKGSPITAANFDAQERIAYSGTASSVGLADGADVSQRFIENDYYFAVAPIDQGGNRGPVATAGPAAAHFNSTILSGGGYSDEMYGYTVEGSTSLDGDAYSDLIVGAYISNTTYIYFGSPNGYPSTPSATIVGKQIIDPCVGTDLSCFGFGRSAKIIGDIDSDGLPDLAVGSEMEDGSGNVYIFKGRHPWPTTLLESDADYVVRGGSEFSGSFNGFAVAPLGDFNGDGVDDFGIGAPGLGGVPGRVSVVYGVSRGSPFGTGSPGTVSLPTDYGTKARELDSPSGTAFGQKVIGLGRFFADGGSTLVASAPAGDGIAFAFHALGQTGPLTVADQTFPAPITAGRTGFSLAFLGGGTSLPLVGIGVPGYTNIPQNGQVHIFGGDVASGPFGGAHAIYTDSRTTSLSNGFGAMVFGSAYVDGTNTSLIGDAAPDVVVGALREGSAATHVYFLTGQNAMTAGTRDIVSAADVSYQMPTDWQGCAANSGAIRDLNGDSYGDIAIGEWRRTTGFAGRVLVLW